MGCTTCVSPQLADIHVFRKIELELTRIKCADVTFTSQSLSSEQYAQNCRNGTGITVAALEEGMPAMANGTAHADGHSEGGSSVTPTSATAASSQTVVSATAAASTGAAPTLNAGSVVLGLGMLAAGVL